MYPSKWSNFAEALGTGVGSGQTRAAQKSARSDGSHKKSGPKTFWHFSTFARGGSRPKLAGWVRKMGRRERSSLASWRGIGPSNGSARCGRRLGGSRGAQGPNTAETCKSGVLSMVTFCGFGTPRCRCEVRPLGRCLCGKARSQAREEGCQRRFSAPRCVWGPSGPDKSWKFWGPK